MTYSRQLFQIRYGIVGKNAGAARCNLYLAGMGSYSIGEAINLLLERSKWKPKVTELRLRQEWEEIVGKTISRYTRNMYLNDGVLTIYTDIAGLKQELFYGKQQLIERINAHLGETAIRDIIVK